MNNDDNYRVINVEIDVMIRKMLKRMIPRFCAATYFSFWLYSNNLMSSTSLINQNHRRG